MGKAIKTADRLRQTVPMMHGSIPPLVIESTGGLVKNSQVMALHPFDNIKYIITARAAKLMNVASLNKK